MQLKTCAQDLGRHYWQRDGAWHREFAAAAICAEIEALCWITLPDAPGGTVTLYLGDGAGLYRVFLDLPRG